MLNHTKYSDLTDEQYKILGQNFIEWSNIEFMLGILLSRLLFTPEFLGRTYSDQMSAVKLEAAIKNALDIHCHRYGNSVVSKELSQEIKEILSSVSKCRTLRNKLAHYLWMRSNDTEIFGSKMSGRQYRIGVKEDSITISLSELKENHEQAHSLVGQLQRLIIDRLPKIEEEQNLTRQARGTA